MATRTMVRVGLVVAAVAACVAGVGVRAGGGERPATAAGPVANHCILCNAYGASQMPRICTSCNTKH